MSTIPTKQENPKGLHQKYFVAKLIQGIDRSKYALEDTILPVDDGAEYFVLKLNEPFLNQPEYEHRVACRIAVNAYADAIQHHLPELAKDLKERYPLSSTSVKVEEGWIKVEDGNVPKETFLLLYNGFWTGVGKCTMVDDYNDEDGPLVSRWEDETSEFISPAPTHYQPLPAPPK